MNLRNVLKTYSLLRSLTDDETALVETFRTMTDGERELLVQSLAPAKPAGKKAAKKSATTRTYDHCLHCGTTKRDSSHKDESSPDYHQFQSSQGKSARAAELSDTLRDRLNRKVATEQCVHQIDDNGGLMPCGATEDNGIHDSTMGYRDYHPFAAPTIAHDVVH